MDLGDKTASHQFTKLEIHLYNDERVRRKPSNGESTVHFFDRRRLHC